MLQGYSSINNRKSTNNKRPAHAKRLSYAVFFTTNLLKLIFSINNLRARVSLAVQSVTIRSKDFCVLRYAFKHAAIQPA